MNRDDNLELIGKRIFVYRPDDDGGTVDGMVIDYDSDYDGLWTLEDRKGRKFTVPMRSPDTGKKYSWAEERR